ncbi:MAG TPA: trypsin-like peptidase domain-containing protein [Gemmataceae bacterium]|nr:trypsin-like peptidase domain-containing protein [Gemmataceae bacterium]
MFKRYFIPALVVVAVAIPAHAQRGQNPKSNLPAKSTPAFLALFKPTAEKAGKSTVRVLVDGKDAAFGAVVSDDGYILTKASEVHTGRVSVKTGDGRDFDAKVTSTSETFDLAVLKVDGTGLVPVEWSASSMAPVGNWVAIPGAGGDPVAVGVVSVASRTLPPPYGAPRIPTEKSGFLGVVLDLEAAEAKIDRVSEGSAAEKAGIKPKDVIVSVDGQEIVNQESLINTLLGYRAGDKVTILLEREGKRMELTATLGKRPADLIPPKGKGGSRGDFQNRMGSDLSDRRTGIPTFLQTDAVVKPTDCGGPIVDLDGHVIGLTIARAGRTESHVIPSERVKALLPILLAAKPDASPSERVDAARGALAKAEADKLPSDVVGEARRLLQAAIADEKWWKEHPLEQGPAPREFERGPAPRTVEK